MKTKLWILTAGIFMIAGFSSCAGGYTCPTYMKNTDDQNNTIMVKELPSVTNEEV